MRPESKILKNHLHAAPAHGDIVDGSAVYKNSAVVEIFEAGDQSKRRGLAAAAFTDDHEKLARAHVQVRLIDGGDGAEFFRYPAQGNRNHAVMLVKGA